MYYLYKKTHELLFEENYILSIELLILWQLRPLSASSTTATAGVVKKTKLILCVHILQRNSYLISSKLFQWHWPYLKWSLLFLLIWPALHHPEKRFSWWETWGSCWGSRRRDNPWQNTYNYSHNAIGPMYFHYLLGQTPDRLWLHRGSIWYTTEQDWVRWCFMWELWTQSVTICKY